MLGLGAVDEDELYTALDWLLERQPAIEATLAKRHLIHGTLVLYDVSSSYMERRHCCPLAKRGYSRDGRKGTLQIVYGLLCAPDGCPVAIEVFDGNAADPMTLASQVEKLKQRFQLDHVVLVGDRGMITQARNQPRTSNLQASTGSPRCARRRSRGCWRARSTLQLSLFDQRDIASIAAGFPMSGWWSAATPISPRSARASAKTCWPPPSAISPASRPPSPAGAIRYAAQPRSRSRSVRCSARPSFRCWRQRMGRP